MPPKTESGLTNHRIEFARESEDADGTPITPTDPAFQTYSDVVREFEWVPAAGHEAQRGLGDVDPYQWLSGPEEHELTIAYDLQKWFVDGSGNPMDASADGLLRGTDGYVQNTHTMLHREEKNQITANSTVNGATQKDTRQYTVGFGGVMEEVTVTGDPTDQQPVMIEATYAFEKARSYQFDQPDSDTTLDVESTADADHKNGVTITIEDEGAATTEDVTLTYDTTNDVKEVATTSSSFPDIDAIWVQDDGHEGQITVTETGGDTLAEIDGTNYHDNPGGYEKGVPPLGGGSHEGAVGTAFETVLGNSFDYGSSRLAMDVMTYALTVTNEIERTPREDDVAQRVHHGTRTVEAEATVIGETESHESARRTLQNQSANIDWLMDGGTLTIEGAHLTEPGGRVYEAGTAVMEVENTFSGTGVNAST